ncbi:MAG: AAA family ATPase [Firmicutes bacterium]|nr:AAA family ATPase [Bacillota bacterium]
MAYTIAVAGKGGTGKTTLSALLIRRLLERGGAPIMAVDADPNANLGEALGMKPGPSIAGILSECNRKADSLPSGMTKEAFIEYRLQGSISEGKGVDLLVMGGPEGPGCYCYVNNLLRKMMDSLSGGYKFVVMDNEAGLEHLSRRTTNDVDILLVTSDPTIKGIRSAKRIDDLVGGLSLKVKDRRLVVLKAPGPTGALDDRLRWEIEAAGLRLAGVIPFDPEIEANDINGKSITDLPGDSPAVRAAGELFTGLGL